jgi:hypothetical protein
LRKIIEELRPNQSTQQASGKQHSHFSYFSPLPQPLAKLPPVLMIPDNINTSGEFMTAAAKAMRNPYFRAISSPAIFFPNSAHNRKGVSMLNNLTNISILAAARAVMPSWMVRINDFDGLELHPCRVIGYAPNGKEIMAPCRPQQAAFWAVYGHYRYSRTKDDLEIIDDFRAEGEARRFRHRLLECFPHLRRYHPVSTH